MVNKNNVSQYNASPPPDSEDGDPSINGGPLYLPLDVRGILDAGEDAINLWTKKCGFDVQKMDMDKAGVATLISTALTQGRYINSQWCVPQPGEPWAACDAYSVTRGEWIENANKYMDFEYYIKFAINRSGNLILTVSCHVSRG